MRSDLKRIEATLQHLGTVNTASYPKPTAIRKTHAPQTKNRSYSFEIRAAVQKRHHSVQQLGNAPEQAPGEDTLISSTGDLQPVTAQQSSDKEPMLPKFNSNISHAHNGSNPVLEMNLLKETQTMAVVCEAELQQIVRQIKDLYMDGPIVDGWLESHKSTPEPRDVTLYGESVEPQMDYVKQVYSFEQGQVTCESPHAGYRLCGLDAAGQKWSRPCPLDQLPSVSIAIARYQKLQQLLERKHYFETCLSQNDEK